MKRYQCHKVVKAAKITAVERELMRRAKVTCDDGETYDLTGDNAGRPQEKDLGYLVLYDDGYLSWSPTKAFEEGYTEIKG